MAQAPAGSPRPLCTTRNRCVAEKSNKGQYYTKSCRGCRHEKHGGKRHPYKKHAKYSRPWIEFRKEFCEECGFIPVHVSQLDVDHIDCNKKNNDPTNLRTLCANCHRLKTWQAKDYYTKKYRGMISG